MTAPLAFLELFAGAGGLSMGLERAGMVCVGHAEINPHARAVLRYRWPDVPLEGDVSALDGARYRGIDVLTGGSPCQDLSIAGKRRGLAGARSSLFHQQARIWNESGAPYLLWENVPGALSSNNGADFAVVLGTLVGAPIAVPKDGWGSAGVAAGPSAVAAWRVLDLQHFGPPQRRARVFVLAARAGGVDPAEVLALSEGVCGHPSPRDQQREGAARGVPAGARGGDRDALTFEPRYFTRDNKTGGAPTDTPTLTASVSKAGDAVPHVLAVNISDAEARLSEVLGTLDHRTRNGSGAQMQAVLAFHQKQTPITDREVSPALGTTTDGMGVLAFDPLNHDASAAVTHALRSNASCTVGPVVTVTGDVTHALTHEGADASEDGTGRGTPIVVPMMFDRQSASEYSDAQGMAPTLVSRDAKDHGAVVVPTLSVGAHAAAPGLNGQDQVEHAAALMRAGVGRPRRLMPIECERLMAWPDDHTRWGVDEQGGTYELKDTPRYQLCGNGVGSDCTAWIGERLVAAVAALRAAHPARTAGAA